MKTRYTLRAVGMAVLPNPTRCGCTPRPIHRAFAWEATIVTTGTVNGIAFMAEDVAPVVNDYASTSNNETCEQIVFLIASALLTKSGELCRSVTVRMSPSGCDGRSIEVTLDK